MRVVETVQFSILAFAERTGQNNLVVVVVVVVVVSHVNTIIHVMQAAEPPIF